MNRKIWSNEEKATIVLGMIKGEEAVAAICARHGVSATQAYRWQEQFLAGG
jgi:transposase-like protein